MNVVQPPSMTTDDPLPDLIRALRSKAAAEWLRAATALSQIGPPALATLIAHLQHSDPFVRGESALALGWMGAAARTAVPFLAQVVRGPRVYSDRPAQPKSADGVISGAATPPIIPAPDPGSAEETCRVYAAQALGRIGPPAARALSDLQDAARTGTPALRAAAEQAVRMIQEQ